MQFDADRFLRAIERRRAAQGLSWRELSRQLDLSASTLSRLTRGRKPDLDTFVRLLAWLDEPAERFLTKAPGAVTQDTMREVARALDEDPSLAPEDARAIEEIVQLAYRRLRQE